MDFVILCFEQFLPSEVSRITEFHSQVLKKQITPAEIAELLSPIEHFQVEILERNLINDQMQLSDTPLFRHKDFVDLTNFLTLYYCETESILEGKHSGLDHKILGMSLWSIFAQHFGREMSANEILGVMKGVRIEEFILTRTLNHENVNRKAQLEKSKERVELQVYGILASARISLEISVVYLLISELNNLSQIPTYQTLHILYMFITISRSQKPVSGLEFVAKDRSNPYRSPSVLAVETVSENIMEFKKCAVNILRSRSPFTVEEFRARNASCSMALRLCCEAMKYRLEDSSSRISEHRSFIFDIVSEVINCLFPEFPAEDCDVQMEDTSSDIKNLSVSGIYSGHNQEEILFALFNLVACFVARQKTNQSILLGVCSKFIEIVWKLEELLQKKKVEGLSKTKKIGIIGSKKVESYVWIEKRQNSFIFILSELRRQKIISSNVIASRILSRFTGQPPIEKMKMFADGLRITASTKRTMYVVDTSVEYANSNSKFHGLDEILLCCFASFAFKHYQKQHIKLDVHFLDESSEYEKNCTEWLWQVLASQVHSVPEAQISLLYQNGNKTSTLKDIWVIMQGLWNVLGNEYGYKFLGEENGQSDQITEFRKSIIVFDARTSVAARTFDQT
ncbi:hypothetical protein HK096_001107 [Nowakowskiella sp. JEL0078]|nr:hypothetical protein HK096_001107 [Nowakowskiella sp. JEL0078]